MRPRRRSSRFALAASRPGGPSPRAPSSSSPRRRCPRRPAGARCRRRRPLGAREARPDRLLAARRNRGGDPLGAPRAARRARGTRRRDARDRRSDVPGCLPQPARRPVPPRRRSGRRSRRDARDLVPAAGARRSAVATASSVRRRCRRGRRHLGDRPLRRARAGRDDVRARGCRRRELLHRRPDLRPATELRHAAGGLLVDPRGACPAPAGATSSCWLHTSSARPR